MRRSLPRRLRCRCSHNLRVKDRMVLNGRDGSLDGIVVGIRASAGGVRLSRSGLIHRATRGGRLGRAFGAGRLTGRSVRATVGRASLLGSFFFHSVILPATNKHLSERSLRAIGYTHGVMAKSRPPRPKATREKEGNPNPVWYRPVMFGFMLLGLAWIIVFYISQATLPVAALGQWNILVGFGIAFVGFLMTTRWR